MIVCQPFAAAHLCIAVEEGSAVLFASEQSVTHEMKIVVTLSRFGREKDSLTGKIDVTGPVCLHLRDFGTELLSEIRLAACPPQDPLQKTERCIAVRAESAGKHGAI